MEFSCKKFTVGKCDGQKVVDGEAMPLVLNPLEPECSDFESLLRALESNKSCFEKMINKNSAVLLRGFHVENAMDFNDIIEILGWEENQYVGPAPRTRIYKRVWTANEGPLSDQIYFHHEMVLMKEFPKKVIFFCEVAPLEGGETPIVPSFKVAERMFKEFPDVLEKIEETGLKYSLTVLSGTDRASVRGRGWEDAFGTSDRVEAEKRAKAAGMDLEWLPNGGVKTIFSPKPLTKRFNNESKGRRMWSNTVVGMHGKKHSEAMMADGTEIPEEVVKRCEEIMEEESIEFKWEKGDVLFLDNHAVLHGRRPSLPPRLVLAAICK